jgi:hypothetical protein
MDYPEEIDSKDPYEDWLSTLRTESTKINYLRDFQRFLDYVDLTPRELYESALNAHNSTDQQIKKNIPEKVYNLMVKRLKEDEVTEATASNIKKVISSYLNHFGIELNWNGYTLKYAHDIKEAFGKGQIRALMENTSGMRNKAIIMMGKDSGLKSSDLCNLIVREIGPILESEKLEFFMFDPLNLNNNKKGLKPEPCIGREAIKYIRLWIEERERLGIPISDNAPLFCALEDKPERITKTGKNISAVNKGDPINSSTISSMMRRIMKKSGFEEIKVSTQSFRKYYQTCLEYAGYPLNWICRLIGSKGKDSSSAYFQPKEKLLKLYEKCYPYLAVYEEIETAKTQDHVIKRIETLEKTNERLWEKLNEIIYKYEQIQNVNLNLNQVLDIKEKINEEPIIKETAGKEKERIEELRELWKEAEKKFMRMRELEST